MRYFIYLSRAKIEMLYPQIPPSFFKSSDAEIKLNLGILSAGIKGTRVQSTDKLPDQLIAVCRYLATQEQVGTIEDPRRFIAGSMPLRYGVVANYASDIAFFGGVFGTKIFGLIGSTESIVGNIERKETEHGPLYYTLRFLNHLIETEADSDNLEYHSWREASEIALANVKTPPAELEFLALVLHHDDSVLVATPLYVALAEQTGPLGKADVTSASVSPWWKFWGPDVDPEK